ncbi:MAG: hypothetical protein IIU03_06120 [Bacteroidales bacterium]|nr:hypothetical protein [Bacteroidales bacterium]MBQ5539798.1 hypothetical protein [Bacteroidales bacterium]MEE3446982.1 hypothetical protein [Bacteroidales bacterium]
MDAVNTATLGYQGKFAVFKYGDRVIRFKAPYSLEKFTDIKEWDNGYLVVMAKYKNKEPEEDYIDIVPILENLYINPDIFLKPIKQVILER